MNSKLCALIILVKSFKNNKMKKIISLCVLFVFGLSLILAQKPERIYSVAKVDKPHEYYVQQAELWWKVVEKDKSNEDAWLNYYKANRYSFLTYGGEISWDIDKKDGWKKESIYLMDLDEILKLIEENIPNTYTDLQLRKIGNPGDDNMFQYLERAYNMRPDDAELYDAIVTYYEMKGDLAKRKEFNMKLFKSNEISSGFLNYSYNLLMTLKPSSIILTFGDNDTYPLWLLQDVLNIRPDILVFNISLLDDPNYQALMFKKIGLKPITIKNEDAPNSQNEKVIIDYLLKNIDIVQHPLYIGLPAWKQLKDFESNLYLVGLALEYSKNNIDNVALLSNNFENNYALDYLSKRFEYDMSESIVDRMNVNYLPGIFKLYEHYKTSGDLGKTEKMNTLGLQIAQRAGQEWIDKAKSVLK
jgi:hypothetical protein